MSREPQWRGTRYWMSFVELTRFQIRRQRRLLTPARLERAVAGLEERMRDITVPVEFLVAQIDLLYAIRYRYFSGRQSCEHCARVDTVNTSVTMRQESRPEGIERHSRHRWDKNLSAGDVSSRRMNVLKPGPVTHLTSFTRHRYKAQLDLFPVLHSWYLMRTCLSDYKP